MTLTELYAWILAQYPRQYQNDKFLIQDYYYPLTFTSIAPGASKQDKIEIAANGDFVIRSINYRASVDSGGADTNGDVVPKLQAQITDIGSSIQILSSQGDIATFMGRVDTAPFQLPWPRMVSGRSALSVALTSYAVADTYSQVTIMFWGLLVQRLGAMGPDDSAQFVYNVASNP